MTDLIKIMHCWCTYNVNWSSTWISKDIFWDGSDGNCTIEYDASTCWNVFLEARAYNFNNLTICPNVKLRFCWEWVPILRVKNHFVNDWEIILRNPLLCNNSSYTDKYLKASINTKCNYLVSTARNLYNRLSCENLMCSPACWWLWWPYMWKDCYRECTWANNSYHWWDWWAAWNPWENWCPWYYCNAACTSYVWAWWAWWTSSYNNATAWGWGWWSFDSWGSWHYSGKRWCNAPWDWIWWDWWAWWSTLRNQCNWCCAWSYSHQWWGWWWGWYWYCQWGNWWDAGTLYWCNSEYPCQCACWCSSWQWWDWGNSIMWKWGNWWKWRNSWDCWHCWGWMWWCSYYWDWWAWWEGLDTNAICKIYHTWKWWCSVFGNWWFWCWWWNSLYGKWWCWWQDMQWNYCWGTWMDWGDVLCGTCTGRWWRAWWWVYWLWLFAKSITNNWTIMWRWWDSWKNICWYRCYIWTDWAQIRMVYENCCNTWTICLRGWCWSTNWADWKLYNHQI